MLYGFQKLAFLFLFIFVAASSYGADRAKESDTKSKIELHEKMATHHQKAADCLKAGDPVEKCNKEAMKDCPMMKTGHCPFMDGGIENMSDKDHMNMMKNKKSQKK